MANRLDTYNRLSAQNRADVARRTNNNAKALEKYDRMAEKDRAKIAAQIGGTTKIAHDAKTRNARAVRTGGQW
ncbi:MAG: hypothetical protein ACI4QT_05835 [Kiritimatiellia bacterium]